MIRFGSGRTPTNLLAISIDTLRADHLDRMPFLQGKAQEGWSVDDTLSCANWTQTATACAMGGRSSLDLADQTGVLVQTGQRPFPRGDYPEGTPFLTDWLSTAGFYSMFVTANGVFGPDVAQGRGFDEASVSNRDAPWVVETGQTMLEDALSSGRIASGQPWYLHLHFFDPHREYDPPASYLDGLADLDPIPYDLATDPGHSEANSAIVQGLLDEQTTALVIEHMAVRYEGEVRYLDDTLAGAWADLQAAGLLDDTLVVVWTDHGEQFYEHGRQAHASQLHVEENDAIWFFWAHDLVGGSTDLPAGLVDIAPTVLDLYGIERPPEVTGSRLDDIGPDRTRFAHVLGKVGPIATVTRGSWKIHWAMADPALTTEPIVAQFAGRAAYDLGTDPLEATPVWDEADADLLDAWGQLEAEVVRMEPHIAPFGFQVLWID